MKNKVLKRHFYSDTYIAQLKTYTIRIFYNKKIWSTNETVCFLFKSNIQNKNTFSHFFSWYMAKMVSLAGAMQCLFFFKIWGITTMRSQYGFHKQIMPLSLLFSSFWNGFFYPVALYCSAANEHYTNNKTCMLEVIAPSAFHSFL